MQSDGFTIVTRGMRGKGKANISRANLENNNQSSKDDIVISFDPSVPSQILLGVCSSYTDTFTSVHPSGHVKWHHCPRVKHNKVGFYAHQRAAAAKESAKRQQVNSQCLEVFNSNDSDHQLAPRPDSPFQMEP